MSNNILKFCKTTIIKLKNIKQNSNCKSILIGVKGGGCNGLKYFIEPTNNLPEKLDEEIKIDDLHITVCGKSLFYLIGTEITWKKILWVKGLILTIQMQNHHVVAAIHFQYRINNYKKL